MNSGFFPTSSNPKTTGSVGIGIIEEIIMLRKINMTITPKTYDCLA